MKLLRWYIFVFLMVFLCSTIAHAEIMLSWDANTEHDLAGYKIYRSSEPGTNYVLEDTLGIITEYTIPDKLTSCVYWVVTAYDFENLESDISNEVSNCDGLKPSPPGTLRINITNSIVTINVINP